MRQMIGCLIMSISAWIVFFRLKNKTNKDKFKMSLILGVFLIGLLLSACSTNEPKTITIPVPMQCPKLSPLPYHHDYLEDLTPLSTAPDFVKACLATRESYKSTVEYCEKVHQ